MTLEKTPFDPAFFELLSFGTTEPLAAKGPDANGQEAGGVERASKLPRLDVDPPVEKTLSSHPLARTKTINQNDIYTWLLAWTATTAATPADLKITIIKPATDAVRLSFAALGTVARLRTNNAPLRSTSTLPNTRHRRIS